MKTELNRIVDSYVVPRLQNENAQEHKKNGEANFLVHVQKSVMSVLTEKVRGKEPTYYLLPDGHIGYDTCNAPEEDPTSRKVQQNVDYQTMVLVQHGDIAGAEGSYCLNIFQ
jgi:hypothetical protein